MADRELKIQISAIDTATATVKELQAEMRTLEKAVLSASNTAFGANVRLLEALQKEISAIREIIVVRKEEEKAAQQSAAATLAAAQAQANAMAAAAKALEIQVALGQQLSDQYSRLELQMGLIWPDQQRQITSAAAAASTLATSLSAAAAADAEMRDAAELAAIAIKVQALEMADLLKADTAFERQMAGRGFGDYSAAEEAALARRRGITRAASDMPPMRQVSTAEVVAGMTQLSRSTEEAKGSLATFEQQLTSYELKLQEVTNAERAAAMAADDMFAATTKGRHFGEMQMFGPAIPKDFMKNQLDEINDVMGAEAQWSTSMEKTKGGFEDVAEGVEKAGSSVARTGGVFQRETRHIAGFFDSIFRGQWGQAISSLSSGMAQLGVSAQAMMGGLGGIIAVMAAVHVLEKAHETAKWAQAQSDAAAAAGMSLDNYSKLAGALSLVGVKGNEADGQLRKLANTVSVAMHNAASKQAEAFHVLGISQEKLAATGGDVDKVVRLLADAFTHSNDSANKSAAFTELLGRDWEKLIPLLQQGSSGIDDLETTAKKLGITISEVDHQNLKSMDDSLMTLSNTFRGEGVQSIIAWSGAIKNLAIDLTALVKWIGAALEMLGKFWAKAQEVVNWASQLSVSDASKISQPQGWMDTALDALGVSKENKALADEIVFGYTAPEPPQPAVKTVADKDKFDVGALQKQVQDRQSLSDAEDAAAEKASRNAKTTKEALREETQARLDVVKAALAADQFTDPTDKAAAEKEAQDLTMRLRHENLSDAESSARAGAAAAKRAAHQAYEDFAAAEREKIALADGNAQKIIAIYQEWASAAKDIYKQHANVIEGIEKEEIQTINTARLAAIKASAAEEEKRTRLLMLNAQLQSMAAGTYKYPGEEPDSPKADVERSQQYIAEAQQVQQAADTEIKALAQVAATADAGSKTQVDAQNEIMNVLLASKEKEVELYRQAGEAAVAAAKKAAAPYTEFFDQLGSQFNQFASSIVKSIMDPQTTIIKIGLTSIKEQQSQVKQAFRQLFMGVAQDLANTLEKALSHAIASALSGGAANTIGELLGNLFSKVFSSVAGQAASSVTGAATQTAPIVSAVTAGATATSTAVTTGAATLGATVTAGSASIVGAITAMSAAEIPLLSAIAFKPTIAGFSYQSGGVVHAPTGLGAQLAILHHREMVLPPHISMGLQDMFRGGSQSANLNYSPVINMGRGRGGTGMTRSEFGALMNMHSGAMLGEARNLMRGGWRP